MFIENGSNEERKRQSRSLFSRRTREEHEKNTNHHIDWRNTRVLWRDNNPYRLLIKESLVIRAHEPQLNRTTHSVPLLVFPEGLERSLIPDPNG